MAHNDGVSNDTKLLRQSLLALSDKQGQLREKFTVFLSQGENNLAYMHRITGANWNRLKAFAGAQGSLTGEGAVKGVCEVLGCKELGQEILELASDIPPRYLGLASASPAVIEVAVGLIELLHAHTGQLNSNELTKIFGPQADIAKAVMHGSMSGIQRLSQPKVLEAIRGKLDDPGLAANLQATLQDQEALRQQLAERLDGLIVELLPFYNERRLIAKAMKVSYSTLNSAAKGRANVETANELIAKAEKLLRKAPAEAAAAKPPPGQPDPLAAWLSVAGGVSIEGVPFVLTEDNFQQLETVNLVGLREGLRRAIQICRLLLNVGTQLKDERARKLLQELGPEVEELHRAIRLFTFAQPNELLPLYDSEREMMSISRRQKEK